MAKIVKERINARRSLRKPKNEIASREYLIGLLSEMELLNEIPGIKTYTPSGAFYIFPDVSAYFGKSDGETTINNASDLCMYILDNAHVSLVTGEAFGDPDCIRLSYAASEADLREAVKRIKETLSKLS